MSSKYVAPVLKSAGFTKHGLIWNRRLDHLVHVIHVEETRWSDEDESEFGINTGVAVDEVHRVVWGEELPSVVRESDCLPRFPYGYLPGVEAGRDIGWKLHNQSDIEQVGPDVMGAIQQKCLPVLDRCRSVQAVQKLADGADKWKQPAERLEFAVLNCLVGQRTEATEILAEMLANPKLKAWHDRVRGVSERLASMA
jgi:hypothetical protein